MTDRLPLRGLGERVLERRTESTTSDRMKITCMTTSTTPRTTARVAEAKRMSGDVTASLYEEAKLFVQANNWEQAKVLLDRLPKGYKNREKYLDQYDQQVAYKDAGIIEEEDSAMIRDVLIQHLNAERRFACTYAYRLRQKGFNADIVAHPGLDNVSRISAAAEMSPGYALLYEQYVKKTANCWEVMVHSFKKIVNDCGGIKGISEHARSYCQKSSED